MSSDTSGQSPNETQAGYRIVVPSRKRPFNMERIQTLFPTASICVDEREEETYLEYVDQSKLILHPAFDGYDRVMNWMFENIECDTLVEIDDDVTHAVANFPKKRRISRPDDLLQIVENSYQAIVDLDLTCFCFCRTMNFMAVDMINEPIAAVSDVCVCMGVRKAAKARRFEVAAFGARADIDWSLRTLLEDRAVYCDRRFYFANGRTFSGRGGIVGLVSDEAFDGLTKTLKERWGSYLCTEPPGYARKRGRSVAVMSLRVNRKNPAALR